MDTPVRDMPAFSAFEGIGEAAAAALTGRTAGDHALNRARNPRPRPNDPDTRAAFNRLIDGLTTLHTTGARSTRCSRRRPTALLSPGRRHRQTGSGPARCKCARRDKPRRRPVTRPRSCCGRSFCHRRSRTRVSRRPLCGWVLQPAKKACRSASRRPPPSCTS
jgi:hypothetical protein